MRNDQWLSAGVGAGPAVGDRHGAIRVLHPALIGVPTLLARESACAGLVYPVGQGRFDVGASPQAPQHDQGVDGRLGQLGRYILGNAR